MAAQNSESWGRRGGSALLVTSHSLTENQNIKESWIMLMASGLQSHPAGLHSYEGLYGT